MPTFAFIAIAFLELCVGKDHWLFLSITLTQIQGAGGIGEIAQKSQTLDTLQGTPGLIPSTPRAAQKPSLTTIPEIQCPCGSHGHCMYSVHLDASKMLIHINLIKFWKKCKKVLKRWLCGWVLVPNCKNWSFCSITHIRSWPSYKHRQFWVLEILCPFLSFKILLALLSFIGAHVLQPRVYMHVCIAPSSKIKKMHPFFKKRFKEFKFSI